MKHKTLIATTILLMFFSCVDKEKSQPKTDSLTIVQNIKYKTDTSQNKNYLKCVGDSIIIDPFEIEIELSDKARERIVNSNETIVAAMFFYGYPKDSTKANSEKDGTLYLVGDSKEVKYGQTIQFKNLKIAKKDYDELTDKDFELNLNVSSGRKSIQENLLDCKGLFGKVSNVVNKKHILKGKLIYGDK